MDFDFGEEFDNEMEFEEEVTLIAPVEADSDLPCIFSSLIQQPQPGLLWRFYPALTRMQAGPGSTPPT